MEYSVDALFNVTGEVTYKGRKLYLRTLSDLDADARLEFVTREAVRAYRTLEDTSSDLYKSYVDTMGRNPQEMVESVLAARTEEIWAAAQKEVYPLGEGVAPKDAHPAKVIEVEAQNQIYKEEQESQKQKVYQDAIADLRGRLEALPLDQLELEALEARKELAINTARYRAWNAYTLYAACFGDETCRGKYFDSPESLYDLNRDAKEYLLVEYQKIDQFSKNYGESGDFLGH